MPSARGHADRSGGLIGHLDHFAHRHRKILPVTGYLPTIGKSQVQLICAMAGREYPGSVQLVPFY